MATHDNTQVDQFVRDIKAIGFCYVKGLKMAHLIRNHPDSEGITIEYDKEDDYYIARYNVPDKEVKKNREVKKTYTFKKDA